MDCDSYVENSHSKTGCGNLAEMTCLQNVNILFNRRLVFNVCEVQEETVKICQINGFYTQKTHLYLHATFKLRGLVTQPCFMQNMLTVLQTIARTVDLKGE